MAEGRERDVLHQDESELAPGRHLAMLNLKVSEDHMSAFVVHGEEGLPGLQPKSLKDILEKAGICHGIVDDSALSDFFTAASINGEPFKVAKGIPPDPGKQSFIRHCFKTNPLMVGMEDESGKIDFKNRGEIPQVKAGDLLAEIIPGVPGKAGMDIFGKTIPAPVHRPVKIFCGNGAYMHPDGMRAYAGIDGRPELTPDGKICVFPDLVISGDVGYATGHVEFDGNVEVRGAIQEGFRVRAQNLRAGEINKADIVVDNDIIVSGGIIGSRVQADGKLQCKHIHTSRLEVLDDIVIESTVFDSEIKTNGRCIVKNGKILSSSVFAKKGVLAADIGSDSSEACELLIGVDNFLENTVDKLNAEINVLTEKLRGLETKIVEIKEESGKLEDDIGALAQEEDHVKLQIAEMRDKIKSLTDAGKSGKTTLSKAKALYLLLGQKLEQTTEKIGELFERQESLEDSIQYWKSEIRKVGEHINALKGQIDRANSVSAEDNGSTAVKVSGTISSGTVVQGPRSNIRLKEEYRNVTIKEAQTLGDDNRMKWSMAVTRNR
jgi:uncharacterized protein